MCHCSISLVLLTHWYDPVCLIIRTGTQHVKRRGKDTFCECHTTDTSVFFLFFLIMLFVKSLFPPVSRFYVHWFSTQVSVFLTIFTCSFFSHCFFMYVLLSQNVFVSFCTCTSVLIIFLGLFNQKLLYKPILLLHKKKLCRCLITYFFLTSVLLSILNSLFLPDISLFLPPP